MPNGANVPSAFEANELVKQLALSKALQSGDATGFNSFPGSAYPLKPESLDKTLVNTSYTMNDIQLFKLMHRNPVGNSVNQYNELTSYGQNPSFGFFPEGGAPQQDSANFVRTMNQIKFQGAGGGITHQLSLQNLVDQDALTVETQRLTMHLLRLIETALWHGNSSLSSLQYDGFHAIVAKKSDSNNTIDMHGKPLTQDVLVDGATYVRSDPIWGEIDHLFCPITIKGDIQRSFIGEQRMMAMDSANDGVLRNGIRAIETPAGVIDLVGNTMMGNIQRMPTRALGSALTIPGTPTVNSASAGQSGLSNYLSGDAGSYTFYVSACNDTGSSVPVAAGSGAINIAAGEVVSINVTPAQGNDTKWFDVYKTTVNGPASGLQKVGSYANTDPNTGIANTAASTIIEFNDVMAGTETAFGFQMTPENMRLDVLAAMLRIPQPVAGTTLPFILVSYLCPILLAPNRILKFKNIGRLPAQTQLVGV